MSSERRAVYPLCSTHCELSPGLCFGRVGGVYEPEDYMRHERKMSQGKLPCEEETEQRFCPRASLDKCLPKRRSSRGRNGLKGETEEA